MWPIQNDHNHNDQKTNNNKKELKTKKKSRNLILTQKLTEQLLTTFSCSDSELGQLGSDGGEEVEKEKEHFVPIGVKHKEYSTLPCLRSK